MPPSQNDIEVRLRFIEENKQVITNMTDKLNNFSEYIERNSKKMGISAQEFEKNWKSQGLVFNKISESIVKSAMKQAESNKVLANQNKFYNEQTEKLGINRKAVIQAMANQDLAFNNSGKVISLSGQKIKNLDTLMKKGAVSIKRVNMNMLGVMFAGMALTRTMNGLLKTSFEWMGIQEIINDTLGVVFLPIAEEVINFLLPISEWFMNLSDNEKKIIGTITLIGLALGTMLTVTGTMATGASSIGNVLGVNIAGGIKNYLKNVNLESMLKTTGAALAIGIAVKDLTEGQVTAAVGAATLGIGIYTGNPLLIGIGAALKLVGDSEFRNEFWGVCISIMDTAAWAGETISKLLSGNLKDIGWGVITNPVNEIGVKLEKMYIDGKLNSDIFKTSAETGLNGIGDTALALQGDMANLAQEIADGKIPIEEQEQAWTEVYDEYKYYYDYVKQHPIGSGVENEVSTSSTSILGTQFGNTNTLIGAIANLITANSKVTDAVISPEGQIISTAPDDYLIATKTPETLGSNTSQPSFSFTYNIKGVSSPTDVKRMIEENNRSLTSEIRRIVKT